MSNTTAFSISKTLYDLLTEFTQAVEKGAEIAEKIKVQAASEGLTVADTRELVSSFSKKKGIRVSPQLDTDQQSITSYMIELGIAEQGRQLPNNEGGNGNGDGQTGQVLPQMAIGTKPALAMRKDIQSVVMKPSEFGRILAEATRDDKKVMLRIKGGVVVEIDLIP